MTPRIGPLVLARTGVALAVAAACAGLLLAPHRLAAENLLANPDFGAGIDGWMGGFQQVSSPSPDDADLCPESGSFFATTTVGGAAARAIALDCIAVAPGEHIHQEVTYRSPVPVYLHLAQFAGAGCTSGLLGEIGVPYPASAEWTTIAVEKEITADNAIAVRFIVMAYDDTGGDGSTFEASFDRAYLGRTARLFADDFEGGSECRWSAPSEVH